MKYLLIVLLYLVIPLSNAYAQDFDGLIDLAESAYHNNNYAESSKYYEKALKLKPNSAYDNFYNAACAMSLANERDKALDYLEQSYLLGYQNYSWTLKDSDLDNIRNTERFKNLILANINDYDLLVYKADTAYSNDNIVYAAILYDSVITHFASDVNSRILIKVATIHALLDSTSKSINYLRKAFEQQEYSFISLPFLDPKFKKVRETPEFDEMMSKFLKPNTIYLHDFINDVVNSPDSANIVYKGKEIDFHDNYHSFLIDSILLNEFNLKLDSSQKLIIVNGLEFQECTIVSFLRNMNIPQIKMLNNSWRGQSWQNTSLELIKTGKFILQGNKFNLGAYNLDVEGEFSIKDHKGDIIIYESNVSFSEDAIIHGEIEHLTIKKSNFFGPEFKENNYLETEEIPKLNIDITTVELKIINNKFQCDVVINSSNVSSMIEIQENAFNGYFDSHTSSLPENNKYYPYNQFKKGLAIFETIPGAEHPTGVDHMMRYTGVKSGDIEQAENFNKLIQNYQTMYNHYRLIGDLQSSNECYVVIRDFNMRRLGYLYAEHGGFKNYFGWKLAQLIKLYTNHGTDPALAVIVSINIIFGFAIFYFFFPSEWDVTSKGRMIANFQDFTQKNDKGYVKPFFVMVGGFMISLLNAVTLSLNSFVTLGFGTIPTTGIARYVCILQGFIGWFLLSLFTVALINQVLF